jgi:hypothetical protein
VPSHPLADRHSEEHHRDRGEETDRATGHERHDRLDVLMDEGPAAGKLAMSAKPESIDVPASFQGLLWEPGSEQEVVFLFGMLLGHLPWPIAIDEIRTAFPDCLARRTDTGQNLRIKFELYGSAFSQHGHDVAGCDVVVCWHDDWRDWPASITVVELSEIVHQRSPALTLNKRPKREARLWDHGSYHEVADPNVSALVLSLVRQLQGHSLLEVRYNGKGKEATCNVCLRGKGERLLWIYGDGRYQWCWEGFRGTEPAVVSLFQRLVNSNHISSSGVTKSENIMALTPAQILSTLSPIADAARVARQVSGSSGTPPA